MQTDPLFSAATTNETRRARAWFEDRMRRGRSEMFTEVADVPPALAEIMLATNARNRSLSSDRVTQYATAMREGRWLLTHQGIAFSDDGKLNDGQHRLSAVIAAGVVVKMMVTFGQPRDLFAVIDLQKVRTPADVLKIAGENNTNNLGAIVRVVIQVERGKFSKAQSKEVTHGDMIAWLRQHSPAAHAALSIGVRADSAIGTGRVGISAAAYLIGNAASGHDEAFFEALSTGAGLTERSPILLARNWLAKKEYRTHAVKYGMGDAMVVCGTVCKAWNRWRRGQTFDQVAAWPSRKEFQFPLPV